MKYYWAILIAICIGGLNLADSYDAYALSSINASASETSKSVKKFDILGLQKHLETYHIHLIDWSQLSSSRQLFVIDIKKINTQNKLLTWLRRSLPRVGEVNHNNSITVYILPVGITNATVEAAAHYQAPKKDMFAAFNPNKVKPIKNIMNLLEIKSLQDFFKQEKAQGIHYERFVNPPSNNSAYSFDVKYLEMMDQMVPVSKNGVSAFGKAEGFIYVGSVFELFKVRQQEKWLGYRQNGVMYLTKKDAEAPLISIEKKNSGDLRIQLRATMPNGTPFSYRIDTVGHTFTSTTHLMAGSDLLVLRDYAKIGGIK